MTEPLLLSASDSNPMYGQIIEQITAKVLAGDWLPGQALPSIRELASASKVSVITVKRAYLELERNGVIVTVQGKGSFVAETIDLQKKLLHEEFSKQLTALYITANQLGLTQKALEQLVLNAIQGKPTKSESR